MTELAENSDRSSRNGIDVDEYRRKIDRMTDGVARNSNSEFPTRKPTRSPYDSAESTFGKAADSFKSSLSSTSKSFDQGFAAAKEKAKAFESDTLSAAQDQFNAAIADVKKPLGDNDFKSPSEFLSTKPANDFKNAIAKTNSQIQSGFKSGVDVAKKTVGGFDQSLTKVNKSLYDMNGNLTKGSAAATKSITGSVDAARQRFSSALGTVSDKAIEAAATSTELGGGLKDKIVAKANEFKPQLRGADNSFKSDFKATVDPVATEARNLLDKAKQKVAGLGTGFDFPEAAPKSLPAPQFKPTTTSNTFGGAIAAKPAPPTQPESSSFGGGGFNRTRVANVTPVESPQSSASAQSPGLASKLTNAWNNDGRQSQLKPIDVGTKTSTPGNALRTASVQSGDFGSTASTIPSAFGDGGNARTSHVMEIDIPSKILSGSSSYAPGSVNKVR